MLDAARMAIDHDYFDVDDMLVLDTVRVYLADAGAGA